MKWILVGMLVLGLLGGCDVLESSNSSEDACAQADTPNANGNWTGVVISTALDYTRNYALTIDQNQRCLSGSWTSSTTSGTVTGFGTFSATIETSGAVNGIVTSSEEGVSCPQLEFNGTVSGNTFEGTWTLIDCSATDFGTFALIRQ